MGFIQERFTVLTYELPHADKCVSFMGYIVLGARYIVGFRTVERQEAKSPLPHTLLLVALVEDDPGIQCGY